MPKTSNTRSSPSPSGCAAPPRLEVFGYGAPRRLQPYVEAHPLGRMATHSRTGGVPALPGARGPAPRRDGHRQSGVPAEIGMALTAHKTVTMFMRYVHTEDDPNRQAAEATAFRECIVVQGMASTTERDLPEKPPSKILRGLPLQLYRGRSKRSSSSVQRAPGSATIDLTEPGKARTALRRLRTPVRLLRSRRQGMSECRGLFPPLS